MGTIKADTVTGLADPNKATIPNTITMGSTTATLNFGNTVIANASAGSSTITGEGGSTITNIQQGLCKCWIHFNGTGTIATDDSFNVSGITDEGTGSYTVTINNDMANDDYAYYGFSSRDNSASQVGMFGDTSTSNVTTGKFRVSELAGSFFDVGVVMCAVHGDLA